METGTIIDKATPISASDFPHEVQRPAGADQTVITRYKVMQNAYQPEEVSDYWYTMFSTPEEQHAFRSEILHPPTSVGALQYAYVKAVQSRVAFCTTLNALVNGLQEINAEMNNYAEHNNLCSEYEEKLDIFNEMLLKAGYTGWFRFEGRQRTYDVLVERTRTVTERTWTQVTCSGSEELESAIAELAIENVQDDDGVWEETDSLDDNYSMIEYMEA